LGDKKSERTPHHHTTPIRKRYRHVETAFAAIPGNTHPSIDMGIAPEPQPTYGGRPTCIPLFNLKPKHPQPHMHVHTHETRQNMDPPLLSSDGDGAMHTITLDAHQNASPHTLKTTLVHTRIYQHNLTAHPYIPITMSTTYMEELSKQTHYTNHTKNPNTPTLWPPSSMYNKDTYINAHKLHISTYNHKNGTHKSPPHRPLPLDIHLPQNFVTNHKTLTKRYHCPVITASGATFIS
jgi:hypothetical protein